MSIIFTNQCVPAGMIKVENSGYAHHRCCYDTVSILSCGVSDNPCASAKALGVTRVAIDEKQCGFSTDQGFVIPKILGGIASFTKF